MEKLMHHTSARGRTRTLKRLPSDFWGETALTMAVQEVAKKDRLDKGIERELSFDGDSDQGCDKDQREYDDGGSVFASEDDEDEDEDEDGDENEDEEENSQLLAPTDGQGSLHASTTPPVSPVQIASPPTTPIVPIAGRLTPPSSTKSTATKTSGAKSSTTNTLSITPPTTPLGPPIEIDTSGVTNKQVTWCVLSRLALIRAETLTIRTEDFRDASLQWGLSDSLEQARKPAKVYALFHNLLRFDEAYSSIRSRFQSISEDSLRSKLSSMKKSKVGALHRPTDDGERALVKAKFVKEHPSLVGELDIYDLYCSADDKRRSAMQISDTHETEDDTLIRVTSRKRARDDALVRLQTQKFTAVEKRRKADSEAKKKATTHLSAMATSVERQAELHEGAVAVSEKLAAETLRHMDAAEVSQRKHTAVLERIAAALEGIHTSIGRYGAPTSMSVAATNSTTSAGDN